MHNFQLLRSPKFLNYFWYIRFQELVRTTHQSCTKCLLHSPAYPMIFDNYFAALRKLFWLEIFVRNIEVEPNKCEYLNQCQSLHKYCIGLSINSRRTSIVCESVLSVEDISMMVHQEIFLWGKKLVTCKESFFLPE